MSPWVQGLRSAPVVAEQTSPGRLATHLPQAPVVVGQVPMVQGLASGSVGSWHEVPRTSLGLHSAPVVTGQALYIE